MIQFTTLEMERLRKKAKLNLKVIKWLINENSIVLDNPLTVPTTGIATWNLYYFCPTHSTRLDWRIDSPTEHTCPIDGEIFKGEPYDGAWWRYMNGLNAKACYHLALLWQLTEDKKYFDKVKEILLEYSRYYPDYEEHGGIPYNNPGKANAQTLCEANCHRDFALGYDLISDNISEKEREFIKERLLREGADFLMKYRSDQLHNHEVKINGTIALIGLILEDSVYLDFAINSKYGLLYQLEHGVSEDGMWFEGSVHYHYYALQGMLSFEKIAKNTIYSNLTHPNFEKMMLLPLSLLLPNDSFPKLNDCISGQEVLNHTSIFELAYSYYGRPEYAKALNNIYRNKSRDNIDAFLYGVEKLPTGSFVPSNNTIHYKDCGITRFKGDNNYFLLKHTPYGGEHDHYDRLGMIFYNNGEEIFNDLGTTGYGAKLHYDYYKNSSTHNTISIEGKNQPPINPRVLTYLENSNFKLIDTIVDWKDDYQGLDSHTRIDWCNESYEGIRYRRIILWLEGTFIEVIKVENPYKKSVDYTLHTLGEIQNNGTKLGISYREDGPFRYVKEVEELNINKPINIKSELNDIDIHHLSIGKSKGFKGKGPGNPSIADIDYLIINSLDEEICYVNTFCYEKNKGNILAEIEDNLIKVTSTRENSKMEYILEVEETQTKINYSIIR